MNETVWWQSKTLWAAAITLVATALQQKYGWVISPEYQAYILAAVIGILRAITTGPIVLSK